MNILVSGFWHSFNFIKKVKVIKKKHKKYLSFTTVFFCHCQFPWYRCITRKSKLLENSGYMLPVWRSDGQEDWPMILTWICPDMRGIFYHILGDLQKNHPVQIKIFRPDRDRAACTSLCTSFYFCYQNSLSSATSIRGYKRGLFPLLFSLENEKQTKQLKNKAVTLQFSGSIGQISIHN